MTEGVELADETGATIAAELKTNSTETRIPRALRMSGEEARFLISVGDNFPMSNTR